jgi:hypothetical protein
MNRILYTKPAPQSVFSKTTQTFPEVLSDPLTRALMTADGVDPQALEMELREVAIRLSPATDDASGFCIC